MFTLTRPDEKRERALLAGARDMPVDTPDLLTLRDGFSGPLPLGFVHDVSRSELGQGSRVFEMARSAFLQWTQFDLGWVDVLDRAARIAPGQLVGIEAHTLFLWSISFNRIVDVVDQPTRFGFLYATTAMHVEQGQERFLLEIDPATGRVAYLLEAVSRPQHPLARLARPLSRAMQHRFAKSTHARMREHISSACQPL